MSDMLEGIGEIVTGQAMIYRMLGDMAAEDIVRTVEAELSKAGGEWSKAQAKVRLALESFTGRIEKAYQAEAQVGSQLERLQEEAIAVRARPATRRRPFSRSISASTAKTVLTMPCWRNSSRTCEPLSPFVRLKASSSPTAASRWARGAAEKSTLRLFEATNASWPPSMMTGRALRPFPRAKRTLFSLKPGQPFAVGGRPAD